MKIQAASFSVAHQGHCYQVRFHYHANGDPATVTAEVEGADGVVASVPNENGDYKPCKTHVFEVLRVIGIT